jgi:hypothetical protein
MTYTDPHPHAPPAGQAVLPGWAYRPHPAEHPRLLSGGIRIQSRKLAGAEGG